jgi:hypothetical protein
MGVVGAIQVLLEDLALAHGAFKAPGREHFPDLAWQGLAVRLDQADQLHGDGGRTRNHAPVAKREQSCATDAEQIHAAVIEEPAVFTGQGCVDELGRDLIEGDPFCPAPGSQGQGAQDRALAVGEHEGCALFRGQQRHWVGNAPDVDGHGQCGECVR